MGAGVAGTSFGIVLPAIARAVPKEKRGWALGVGTAAGSFGQFLVVPMMQFIVDAMGWFAALQVLGLTALAMAILVLPLGRFGAAMGLLWLATVPPTSGLIALFFGTRYMTFLYGIVFCSHQIGSFTGIWLAGIVLALVAAVLHWPIREQKFHERLAAATTG